MMSFDSRKWQLAVAFALSAVGAACSSGGGGGDGTNVMPVGTGGQAGSTTMGNPAPISGGGMGGGPMAMTGGPAGAAGMAGMAGGSAGMAGMAGGSAGMAGMAGGSAGMAGMAGGGEAGESGAGGTPEAGAGGMAGNTGSGSCLDGITGYDKDGPFQVKTESQGAVNFWVPMVPAGCKVPVVHLANGTGATCGAYGVALNRMATHGFLACCYEDPNTGAGDFSLMAIQAALEKYPDLADMKFGSTGHSQGGQASFTGLQLMEAEYGDKAIYAGLAMEPASGFGVQPSGGPWQSVYAKIKSPFFMFAGLGTDGLVSQGWVQQAFDALSDSVEAYFWTANGATHIPVPNGEEQQISIPWFRWKLLGDQAACKYFKAIPMMDNRWVQQGVQNEQPCM